MDLQNKYAPKSICFGCGPANDHGLKIQSIPDGDNVYAVFQPQSHHHAFPNILSGGIIGTLLDCHSNWTAAWAIMNNRNEIQPPCTVTAKYTVNLLKPCPTKTPVKLIASIVESNNKKAIIKSELIADDIICATCDGIFIAVEEGHPAYNRW